MAASLAAAAFLMGLAGGPHCAAMCGAPCAGVIRVARASPAGGMLRFQLGRLVGYSLAGAAAGFAMQAAASLSSATAALRPVWTLMHLAILAWGLALLVLARQPAWVDAAGRSLWSRVGPVARSRGGLFASGMLWAFMPCGLLYSALVIAALAGGPLEGALAMALFAAGSGVSLGLFPPVLDWLRRAGNRFRGEWGTRASGVLLAGVAVWGLASDTVHRIAAWCGIAL